MAGKVLVLSMGLMYLCLFGSLLWSHLGASTNVYSVARWYSEGRNLTRQERQKLMQHSILRTRCVAIFLYFIFIYIFFFYFSNLFIFYFIFILYLFYILCLYFILFCAGASPLFGSCNVCVLIVFA